MSASILVSALVGLLPVLCFLAALLYLDSYKLVKLRAVIAVVACGIAVAGASYLVNGYAIDALDIDFTKFTRYVGPVTEELLKGLVIVLLIRAHRIGFRFQTFLIIHRRTAFHLSRRLDTPLFLLNNVPSLMCQVPFLPCRKVNIRPLREGVGIELGRLCRIVMHFDIIHRETRQIFNA